MSNTIKPQDLRIGNLIKIDGIVRRVDARTIFDFEHDGRVKEPIPLTEEILVKCKGFKLDYMSKLVMTAKGAFYSNFSHDNEGYFVWISGEKIYFHFLHQLQNAYYILMSGR